MDLYFAPFDNVFTVAVDPVTGVHGVSIDPAYHYHHQADDPHTYIKRRGNTDNRESVRTRRDLDDNATTTVDRDEDLVNSTSSEQADGVYRLMERVASEFVTFVSVRHPDTFLVVRGVRNRFHESFVPDFITGFLESPGSPGFFS